MKPRFKAIAPTVLEALRWRAMNRGALTLSITVLFVLLLSACGSRESSGCIPPPKEFSEKDLVGTWNAGLSWRSDTLIVRENGTYKQIIHIERYTEDSPFDYESDWQPWRMEYGENGLPYLHMEGMRLCAYAGGYIDCNVVGGGKTTKWYDPCRKTWVQMPGEGVLIVLGTPKGSIPPPRSIQFALFQRGEDGWGYWLKEPTAPTATLTSPPQ